jgi:uncharacterized protein YjbI with pentapeptide repeats
VRVRGNAEFRGAEFSGGIEFRGAQLLGGAYFEEVQFTGEARFDGVQFNGDTVFQEGRFTQDAWFEKARFRKGARFWKAQFGGDALFSKAKFTQDAVFDMAQFSRDARFLAATFHGDAWFTTAQMSGFVSFDEAQFDGDAWFNEAQFTSGALFDEAQFTGLAQFVRTRFGGEARFWRTQFKRAGSVGPVFAGSRLVLDRTVFERDILIQVIGSTLVCTASQFAESATLRLRYAQVVLDGTVFTKPSTVAFAFDPWKGANPEDDQGADPGGGVEVEPFGEDLMVGTGAGRSSRPRLLSLRGVDVATLTLSELDLAGCLFQGAHHLDQVRIEGARPFADTPAPGGCTWAAGGFRCGAGGRAGKRWPKNTTGGASVLPRRCRAAGRGWSSRPGMVRPARPLRWSRSRPVSRCRGCYRIDWRCSTGRCARPRRTARTSPVQLTSTTARWRCDAVMITRHGPSG